MNKRIMSERLWVGIDVGTTKICVIVAQMHDEQYEIIGIGKSPSHGLARGVVVDIAQTTNAIKAAVEEAELMANIKIEHAYVGISGAHIKAHTSQGMIPLKHGEVRQQDITNVINTARSFLLPEGHHMLHVIPQQYTIDGEQHIRNPLGMQGIRLEASVHLITGHVSSVQNLVRCCEYAGVSVKDIILEPLASAAAILSNDEQELGVGILDIGGGTADFALYRNNALYHTHIIPIGGTLFTKDIALCLRTTLADAEHIKQSHGSVSSYISNDTLEVALVHGEKKQPVTSHELVPILEARTDELFTQLNAELRKHNLMHAMPAGLVLTGGGSLLNGLVTHASTQLHMPCRIGMPRVNSFTEILRNPMYATSWGLIAYTYAHDKQKSLDRIKGPLLNRVLWRMKTWVADFF